MTNDLKNKVAELLSANTDGSLRRFKSDSPFMEGLTAITMDHLKQKRGDGEIGIVEAADEKRIFFVQAWNDFIRDEDKFDRMPWIISSTIRYGMMDLAYDLDMDKVEGNEEALAEAIARQIETGFSIIEKDTSYINSLDHQDRLTGDTVKVSFGGWEPKIWTNKESDGYETRRLDLAQRSPSLVHMTLPAGEPIWVISGRDSTEMIENTLFAAHIDKCDSSMWINSHKGKVDHARETYEKTGVMDVSIGDYFPRPVIEKETGKTWLINFGDLVSQAEADELKAEGNEDFNAGYYMVKDERFDAPEGSHLEHFRIAPQNEIIALMVAEQGITPEEALKELEEAAGIDSGSALRLDPFPDEAHIYMSYGAKVKEAHRVMSDAGQMPFTGGRQTVMIISPDVIDFGPALVEELNARRVSADHEIEDDTPSP